MAVLMLTALHFPSYAVTGSIGIGSPVDNSTFSKGTKIPYNFTGHITFDADAIYLVTVSATMGGRNVYNQQYKVDTTPLRLPYRWPFNSSGTRTGPDDLLIGSQDFLVTAVVVTQAGQNIATFSNHTSL